MTKIDAWVAPDAKQKFVRQEIDLGPLGDEDVEVAVQHCGVCHSDLSVLNNDWGFSQFPAVLGHETGTARQTRQWQRSRLLLATDSRRRHRFVNLTDIDF
jgi:hypothetical protein